MSDSDEKKAILQRWRTIISQRDRDTAMQFTDNEPAGHLLHIFRPDGAGLEALFEGMPRGEEVLARLRAVFAAGGATDRGDLYFIPRHPKPASAQQLESWVRDYFERMGRAARALWGEEIADDPGFDVLLDGNFGVHVITGGAVPARAEAHDVEKALYEITTEFGGGRKAVSEHGDLLREPLYMLACDYALAYWTLWPQLKDGSLVDDPFAPWFELWRHGADLCFADEERGFSFDEDGIVRVWVARLSGPQLGPPSPVKRRRPDDEEAPEERASAEEIDAADGDRHAILAQLLDALVEKGSIALVEGARARDLLPAVAEAVASRDESMVQRFLDALIDHEAVDGPDPISWTG